MAITQCHMDRIHSAPISLWICKGFGSLNIWFIRCNHEISPTPTHIQGALQILFENMYINANHMLRYFFMLPRCVGWLCEGGGRMMDDMEGDQYGSKCPI